MPLKIPAVLQAHAGVRTPGLPTLHATQSLPCYKYNRVSVLAAVELHMESGFAFFATGLAGRLVRQAPWCFSKLRYSVPIDITANYGTCMWAPCCTVCTAAAEALRACAENFGGEPSPLKILAVFQVHAGVRTPGLSTLHSTQSLLCHKYNRGSVLACCGAPHGERFRLFSPHRASRSTCAASTAVPWQPALQRAHCHHCQLWNLLVGAVLHCLQSIGASACVRAPKILAANLRR